MQYGPPQGGAFLLIIDGNAVGCVGIRQFEPGIAELKRMYIQPPYRGKGYGKALLDAYVSIARSLGYRKIRLDTLKSMERAGILYQISLASYYFQTLRMIPAIPRQFFMFYVSRLTSYVSRYFLIFEAV
ncbi:MAG: GNAT family N-acetyltransferase [Bacteroidota bacterium]